MADALSLSVPYSGPQGRARPLPWVQAPALFTTGRALPPSSSSAAFAVPQSYAAGGVHRDCEGLRVARVVPTVGSAAVVKERDAHRGRAVSVIGGRVAERAIGSYRRLSREQRVVVVGDLEVQAWPDSPGPAEISVAHATLCAPESSLTVWSAPAVKLG